MIAGQLWRFAAVGALNTAVGYAAILLLQFGADLPPMLANAGGYLIGFGLSYTLHRSWTFGSRQHHGRALPLFALAVLAAFAINLLVLEACLRWAGWPVAVAQAVAVSSYAVAFFLLSRSLVFRDRTRGTRGV